jgi:hypothetical protein
LRLGATTEQRRNAGEREQRDVGREVALMDGVMGRIIEWMMTWIFMPFVIVALPAMVIGVVALVGNVVYKEIHPPETFQLRVDSWTCTKSYKQDRRVCTKGCRWVTETVCTEWTAK